MKLFDLHAHPSLKAFGNHKADNAYDIWKKRFNKFDGKQIVYEVDEDGFFRPVSRTKAGRFIANMAEDSVALYSQSNLDDAVHGNVGCVVLSFYPVEQEFYKRGKVSKDHVFDKILSMASGQSVDKINSIQSGKHSYYEEYLFDRSLLLNHEGIAGAENPDWNYKVVSSYKELQEVVNENKKVAIILSIEGVQSLANKIGDVNNYRQLKDEADKKSQTFNTWKNGLLENINAIKQSKDANGAPVAPILFLTVAHHFFNFVCGHCKSLKFTLKGYMLDQEDTYHEQQGGQLKNTHYFDIGLLEPFGKDVIRALLKQDPDKGLRRIIIDTKHMSPKARIEFYDFLEMNYQNEAIPIICSHTSVNGIKEIRRTSKKDKNLYFNASDINTFDDDIIQIYKRDGLIGIMLDDGRSCSKAYKVSVRKLDNEIERKSKRILHIRKKYGNKTNALARTRLAKADKLSKEVKILKELLENEYCDIFFRQLFHIINVLNSFDNPNDNAGADAWKIITIGSDFDGVINPYDYYGSYSRLDDLRVDLIERWNEHLKEAEEDEEQNDFTKNVFDKTPEYWVNRVFWHNSDNFLRKYFHDEYLIHGRKGS